MSSLVLLAAYSIGILVTFMWRELINDALYSTSYGEEKAKFEFSVSVVFIQSVVNLLFAWIWPWIVSFFQTKKKPEITEVPIENSPAAKKQQGKEDTKQSEDRPVSKFWLAVELSVPALCQTLSGYMGNKSLEFVDMTTKTVCKSMKPVPILLIGLLMGNSYHWARKVGVVALSVGITGFMLAGSGKSGGQEASMFGFVLALGAVMMDGFVGSSQERIGRLYKPSASLLMSSVQIWGIVLSGATLLMSGELPLLLAFTQKYPEVWSQLLEMSIANPLGNFFVFQMIATFGALQCSIITTSRKFMTILFNTVWFGRSVHMNQWIAVGVVFIGVVMDTFGSTKDKARKSQEAKNKVKRA
eukprot:TRINITY_DN16085_c0_g1_i1.p1 TRINITY_DN16085_c0_g1~~TRINITY_DN16085_c0_g1_i1.p1  ORF type:complete len:357 (-),score=75.32 TRINITY_DN16085_c0_g1_i1:93-1163(-)